MTRVSKKKMCTIHVALVPHPRGAPHPWQGRSASVGAKGPTPSALACMLACSFSIAARLRVGRNLVKRSLHLLASTAKVKTSQRLNLEFPGPPGVRLYNKTRASSSCVAVEMKVCRSHASKTLTTFNQAWNDNAFPRLVAAADSLQLLLLVLGSL